MQFSVIEKDWREKLAKNIVEKILADHLIEGNVVPGDFIEVKVNHTLLQDALGTMACLQFEKMGYENVHTDLSIIYVDHNMLQTGYENADDHRYLKSFAEKYGLLFSKPGNGICHQLHLERFGYPGGILIGSDSHTPTCGGLGMLAIGAGGLEVAATMGTGTYYLKVPEVIQVELKGTLKPGCSAKDIILKVLSILSVKGGVGKIIEYSGDGVDSLTVYERATITNMGAELGATTSVFPSDAQTQRFLSAQERENEFLELSADKDANYVDRILIDLTELEPLIALPHSPDKVKKVSEIGKIKVDQVCIGSCTNSSFSDLMLVAEILKGKTIHKDVSLTVSPGSKQVLNMLAQNGALSDIISSGARILESACGPCIGMGQAPASGAVSLRTFNRNFEKRSGTDDAQVYLVSPETAVASALSGYITALSESLAVNKIALPQKFIINDNLIVHPPKGGLDIPLEKGKNIKPFTIFDELKAEIAGKALIKVGNNITTDHIVPGGSLALANRSNIPFLSKYCLVRCDERFPDNAQKFGGGFIIGGENYGQGSSREHAALVPVYLGIRAIIAKSFARIHKTNLINTGIIPLVFKDKSLYESVNYLDDLQLIDVRNSLKAGMPIRVIDTTGEIEFDLLCETTQRERNILLAGGLINYICNK